MKILTSCGWTIKHLNTVTHTAVYCACVLNTNNLNLILSQSKTWR